MDSALPSFVDKQGQKWDLEINIAQATRLKRELGVDLDKVEDGQLFIELATSRATQGGVLWVLCEEQADRLEIGTDEFTKRLCGSCLDEALIALVGAIINFTPQPKRPVIQMMWEEVTGNMQEGQEMIKEWTMGNREKIQETLKREVTGRAEKAFGELSTS